MMATGINATKRQRLDRDERDDQALLDAVCRELHTWNVERTSEKLNGFTKAWLEKNNIDMRTKRKRGFYHAVWMRASHMTDYNAKALPS